MIKGNIHGIKDFTLGILDDLHETKLEKGQYANPEVLEIISTISASVNREINITIDRKGNITDISIGDNSSATLPAISVNERRLSGVSMIHTHPSGNSKLSMMDISALIQLKLDMIVALGISPEGAILEASIGFCNIENNNISYINIGPLSLEKFLAFDFISKIEEVEKLFKSNVIVESINEKAILVGIDSDKSLDELEELAKACNINTVGRFLQKRTSIDNVTFIGSGKVKELAMFKQIRNADLIIFDEELTGIQTKNIEEITGCKVIDRTVLILEIFAKRAKSREGKLQVQLARLKYSSTKLIGYGISMSRTGGGIGSKGLGETKLELDRRTIKEHIHALKLELEKIRKSRMVQREKRDDARIPKISLVGYTNVGKSTLRNLLVNNYSDSPHEKEDVFAENMLFATLDVTTRTIILPDKRIVSLTDTVGFIRKLPHDLVEAFKSTLEEVTFSDLIVHVVDGSSPNIETEISAVETVMSELKANNKPTILAINKIDNIDSERLDFLKEKYKNYRTIEISAKSNINIDKLLETIETTLPRNTSEESYLIPYSDTNLVAMLHRTSIVKSEEYKDNGVYITATVDNDTHKQLENYVLKN
ncbi:GTPase HflX [Fusobacterium sp. PH5-44]|uniref:GTPase HflX n=1 Tax=unclassified Fusobacterium TaxID=2648384 RepID=UPI003D1F9B89